MRLLVCGGRHYDSYQELKSLIDGFKNIEIIIHGGAKGADKLVGKIAREKGIEEIEFPANWEEYGRAAGPIRNKQMLDEGKPDAILAVKGGRGTENMINQALKAGVEVYDYNK